MIELTEAEVELLLLGLSRLVSELEQSIAFETAPDDDAGKWATVDQCKRLADKLNRRTPCE